MNTTHLTEIAFVLDRSGSMASELEAAIAGFNKFLRDQQATPGEARFTLVLFDDQYEIPCASIPIREVVELDTTTFVPRGSTALLDAIGRTIDELDARIAAMPAGQRPQQVIVAILTDGFENSSRKFSYHDIADKIARQRDSHGWQFFFLGATQDSIASAASINIAAENTAMFDATPTGYRTTSGAMSRKIRAMRKSAAGGSMTFQEQADLKATLSDIVAEEDGKAEDGK